jgi:Protein of unknown function (DUF2786)
MSDKKAQILEKVRKLLAKAASTPFEAEAQTFREKADQLMAVYAIEAWQVAQGKEETRVNPESRNMDIAFFWDAGTIGDELWSLFWSCADHARCAVVYYKATSYTKSVPVVGLPADLDYMDMLFTDLMVQLVSQLDPKPDIKLGYFENLKRMREAGKSWPDTAKDMLGFGFDPRPNDSSFKVKQDQMTRDYRSECKKRGIPQNYNHHKTFGRNFAAGFVGQVAQRMRDMRQTSQGEADATGSMALAIRDIKQAVKDARDEMFGAPPKSRGRYAMDQRKVDLGARMSGTEAGASARIASNASQVGNRKGKQLNK